jgi:hypothetical protein
VDDNGRDGDLTIIGDVDTAEIYETDISVN